MEESQTCLPQDMLLDIFLRLEVKSLLRIRCVCKSWYRIICSSTFITATVSSKTNEHKDVHTLYTHLDSYSLVRREGFYNDKKYYYIAEQFGINIRKHNSGIKVYGSCNGLLCVSDVKLRCDSIVYLLNPIIRRAKNIPKIPIEVLDPFGGADLCLGYFDDDYKVIKLVGYSGIYSVGVYSLRTDSWKIISCDCDVVTFGKLYDSPSSKCVNGVAYFVRYAAEIVCFDLHDERIRQVKFPEKFDPVWWPILYSCTLEACGESVALMEISHDGHLVKWVLKNCGLANSLTWEKESSIGLQRAAHNIHPIGFTYDGIYIVRSYAQRAIRNVGDRFYLCDLRKSELKKLAMPQDLQAIDYLAGNLVLLNEQTLDPFVELEATCSTKTTFVLCKRRPPKKKAKAEILGMRRNEVQGSRTKRKLEEIKMKKI